MQRPPRPSLFPYTTLFRSTDAPGRLRVALRGVAAARLVAHEDVADAAVDEGVVGGEVGAAGEAEYDVDALGLQALHHGIDRAHALASSPWCRGSLGWPRRAALKAESTERPGPDPRGTRAPRRTACTARRRA